MMRAWLRKNDVDLSTIKVREITFPDKLAELWSGSIAAAGVTEPFYTLAQDQGTTALGHYFTDV